jgi:hypothetical protein
MPVFKYLNEPRLSGNYGRQPEGHPLSAEGIQKGILINAIVGVQKRESSIFNGLINHLVLCHLSSPFS